MAASSPPVAASYLRAAHELKPSHRALELPLGATGIDVGERATELEHRLLSGSSDKRGSAVLSHTTRATSPASDSLVRQRQHVYHPVVLLTASEFCRSDTPTRCSQNGQLTR